MLIIEHIFKRPANNRQPSALSTIEFFSNQTSDAVLKKMNAGNVRLTEDGQALRVDYARTKRQLKRNWSVNEAEKLIKADPRSAGKNVR